MQSPRDGLKGSGSASPRDRVEGHRARFKQTERLGEDRGARFKGPVCKIQGDLFAEMEYDIHKYVFITV